VNQKMMTNMMQMKII